MSAGAFGAYAQTTVGQSRLDENGQLVRESVGPSLHVDGKDHSWEADAARRRAKREASGKPENKFMKVMRNFGTKARNI